MHGEWNPAELTAALSAMQDEGLGQGEIADLAGVNRSQVNRWARGENRPTYDRALQLARRTGQRMPELAARFMAAAGYPWDGRAEPAEPDEPPPGISRGLYKAIKDNIPDKADRRRVMEFILLVRSGQLPVRREGTGERRKGEGLAG